MQDSRLPIWKPSERLSKVKAIYVYVLVMATILMSKSVYFGILNLSIFRWVYYALIIVGFVLLCSCMRAEITGFLRSMGLVALLLANVLFHFGDMSSSMVNEVIGFALDLAMTSVMVVYINRRRFMDVYVNCIIVIAVISLICVTIANLNKTLALLLVSNSYDWTTPFGYSIYYTWGHNGTINPRNSGVFWEPGAFVGFLIVAILFLLYGKTQSKHAPAKMLILLVTLLTTRSTTGYILLIFMMLTMHRDFIALFTGGERDGIFGMTVGAIVVIASVLIVASSGNIVDKLNGVSYLGDGYASQSATIRFSDVFNSLLLSVEAGLLGFGDTAARASAEMSLVIKDNSVGLLHLIYTYGWLFAIAYYYVFFSGIKHLFSNCSRKILICIALVFIVLFATEGLYWLPTYLAIAFIAFNDGDWQESAKRTASSKIGGKAHQ